MEITFKLTIDVDERLKEIRDLAKKYMADIDTIKIIRGGCGGSEEGKKVIMKTAQELLNQKEKKCEREHVSKTREEVIDDYRKRGEEMMRNHQQQNQAQSWAQDNDLLKQSW